MKRVVMVGPFGMRPRATMGVRALPMAQALAARGHRVTLLLPPWQNPEDSGRAWEADGVQVENVSLPPGVPGLFHLATAWRLARRAVDLQPDVVHLFKPKAYAGLAHWLLAHLPCRPRLVVDTDDWEGPGGWNDLNPYSPAQKRFFTWQERWGLTHADAVTVASRALQSLVWSLGVPPSRVFYVPNGVPPSTGFPLPARTCNLQPATDLLLYTRFFEFPVSRVIDLLVRVRERVPGARLVVYGQGLFGEERELQRLAHERGLAGAVVYNGWLDPALRDEVFSQAALAIYPFDDTLVNRTKCAVKLLELLSAGVPVVAEAVGQNVETIRHAQTGWLVPPGDVPAFADAVVRLLLDGDLRGRLARAAAVDVRGRLGWEELCKVVERAYDA